MVDETVPVRRPRLVPHDEEPGLGVEGRRLGDREPHGHPARVEEEAVVAEVRVGRGVVDRLRGPGEAPVEPGDPLRTGRGDDDLTVLLDLERQDDLQLDALREGRLGEDDLGPGRESPEGEADAVLHEGPVDPLAQLVDFSLRLVGLAQLLFDGFQLLTQVVFALAFVDIVFHLGLNLIAQFKNFHLVIHHAGQFLETLFDIGKIQHLLFFFHRCVDDRRDQVSKRSRLRDGLGHGTELRW